MTHDQILRIQTKNGANIIKVMAQHNLRELAAALGADSHIDATRICLNRVLLGAATADGVVEQAKALMKGTPKPRRDAIRGIELVVSLPARSNIDVLQFFHDTLIWVDGWFFGAPVVSAVAHFDESCPHLHVILLPLLDGRLQGSVLAGDRKRIQAMQGDFHDKVGSVHGLTRKAALAAPDRRNAAVVIHDMLMANPGLLDGGLVKRLLLDVFAKDPLPLLTAMGLPLPEPKAKQPKTKPGQTFAGVMTKPMKPEKPNAYRTSPAEKSNTYRTSPVEKARPLSCVGVGDSLAPDPSASGRSRDDPADSLGDYQRVRDDSIESGQWDEMRGEWRMPTRH